MKLRPFPLHRLASALLFLLAAMALVASAAGAATGATLAPTVPPDGSEPLPPGASVETVIPQMGAAIAMAFDPQGRLFYTEKGGNVRLFANGTLQTTPVKTFAVSSCGERGLLGIALDPDFSTNRYVYVYYTAAASTSCGSTQNKVVRFVESGGVGSDPAQEIFTSPQTAGNHVGGNIHFGPDGKLYITVGDNASAANSQDLTVKQGKIHRINPDGSIPTDNPFYNTPGAVQSIYARGLRNSFDFAFDSVVSGRIFATENGPSCDDEMNRIERGYNYGWRANLCEDTNPDPAYNTIPPLWYLPSGQCCQVPTGIEVYRRTQIPQWQNHLFMATYSNGALRHFYLNQDRTQVTAVNIVQGVTVNMDIETGPDGAFYYIQGGGYTNGTLKRIAGLEGSPTSTATTPPTQTATRTPTRTNTVAISPTATATGTPPTATPTTTACTAQFSDVPQGSTFYEPVRCLACRGVLGGYADGTFRPNNNVTRGQIAKIVSNAAGLSDAAGGQIFEDVPPTDTFYEWINRLARRGVMGGYPCGTNPSEPCRTGNRPYFRPYANATRGQLSKIVAEAAGFGEMLASQSFQDVPPGSTFYQYVERLRVRGVMGGYPCGGHEPQAGVEPCVAPLDRPYFRPNNNVTRGQTAKIVSNSFFPGCEGPAPAWRVNIDGFAYDPETITVPAGTTVYWRNFDLDYHTVTANDGSFDSGRIDQNEGWQLTFNTPGSYPYYCIPHPYMGGTVIVMQP